MRRVLGFGDLLLIAAAAIGPAFSLATTFGPMVAAGGSATPFALFVVTAIMVCVAIAYRRLGARYPNAGSAYTWVRIAFGPRAGAYAAWVLIVANLFAIVATALPAGIYTLSLLALFVPGVSNSPLADGLVGAVWVLGAGLLLYRGLRPTSRLANALAVAELLLLAAAAAFAALHPPAVHAAASAPPPGVPALIGAVAIGIWMIDGWEVSASTAEEAFEADSAPGAGGLAGLLLTAVVLWVCMTAFLRVGTLDGFAAHEGDAMAYVGDALGGGWRIAITVTVLVSLAAALQTTLIYLTRSFFAMGRDGVLPQRFGALDAREQPAFAVVVLTAAGVAGMLASAFFPSVRAAFDFILSGTTFYLGVLFLLSAAAAVRIFARERTAWLDGVALPAVATVALLGVLAVSVAQADRPTQLFLLATALAGVLFARWRGPSTSSG
ncbi:MAG TPA: APC family permease [Candidatus Lustribacter sp.]|jgi:amino acid transporter|nr:APC family permease [Candidatus Lustribacter sp.]